MVFTMALHPDYIPVIKTCLKAIVDERLIPCDRIKNAQGIYNFENEINPSIRYAMAVHNFVTYFNQVSGITDVVQLRSEIIRLKRFFSETEITTAASYQALKIFLAYVEGINIDVLKMKYSLMGDQLDRLRLDELKFKNRLYKVKHNVLFARPCHQYILEQLNKSMYPLAADEKLRDARANVAKINKLEEQLVQLEEILSKEMAGAESEEKSQRMVSDAKQISMPELQSIQDAKHIDKVTSVIRRESSMDYQVYVRNRLELKAKLKRMKEEYQKYIPQKQACNYTEDLENYIKFENNILSLNAYSAVDIHKIPPSTYSMWLPEEVVTQLNSIHEKASEEANGRFSRFFKQEKRNAYKLALMQAMQSQISAMKKVSKDAINYIQPSLNTDLKNQQQALSQRVNDWDNELVDNRFFLVKLWSPRPIELNNYINALKLAINMDNPEPKHIALCAQRVIQFIEAEQDRIKRSLSIQQQNKIVAILNQAINYCTQLVHIDDHQKIGKSTKLIAEQLSMVVLPSQLRTSKAVLESSKHTFSTARPRPNSDQSQVPPVADVSVPRAHV